MKELLFDEYIKPDIGHSKYADKIITQTIGQISRGRYEITDHLCKVTIILEHQKRTVLLSNSTSLFTFWELTQQKISQEPSFRFLSEKISLSIRSGSLKRVLLYMMIWEYAAYGHFPTECCPNF